MYGAEKCRFHPEMMDTHSKNDALDKVYQSLLEHRGTILKENQRMWRRHRGAK